ncbi:hypothetical protein K3012_003049 [Salmonella enterica]|nr:hypothetical protein [Salmonella enterica]EJZ7717521.1 hypothetical protein [Salmonella enterica]
MAKAPKKVTHDIQNVDMRTFVSSAAQRPESASKVTRVNITIKNDDLAVSDSYQEVYSVSRADVYSAGMSLLQRLSDDERKMLFEEIRKKSPKAGRPSVKK